MSQTSSIAAGGFIAGPIADSVFLIGAPLVAVLVYLPFHLIELLNAPMPESVGYLSVSIRGAFISIVIQAHLFIVVFRSHANGSVFQLHPFRFTVVPLALFAAMCWSPVVLALVGMLTVWWDVYHSSLQTFGIGRIYDSRRGNDVHAGRTLDRILNLLLYAGPILGGATLVRHVYSQVEYLDRVPNLSQALFHEIPSAATGYGPIFAWGLVAFAVPFCLYYVWWHWRRQRRGYRVSFQKVFLLVTLAPVSLFCWGFNSFGEAFFVMNFLHAWQYFFLVWHTEKKNLTSVLRLTRVRSGRQIALAAFLFAGTSYGVWVMLELPSLQPSEATLTAIMLVVSIMHFWYDGFIWSVRKGHV